MASAPTRKKAAVRGMRWMRPPSPSRSRRPVACSTAPAPRNSSDLNQEWFRTCSSAGRHGDRRARVLAVGAEGQRQAQRHEDHADILDRRIGEHALEIAVEHGIEQPQHGRQRAEHDRRQRPPPGRRPQQIEGDAHEAVDRHLGHDAAHQRRDVAGRRRMGERQPGMQRHEAALGAAADQGGRQDQGGDQRGRMVRADGVEGIAAGRAGQPAEGEQKRRRADRRHDEIEMPARRLSGSVWRASTSAHEASDISSQENRKP